MNFQSPEVLAAQGLPDFLLPVWPHFDRNFPCESEWASGTSKQDSAEQDRPGASVTPRADLFSAAGRFKGPCVSSICWYALRLRGSSLGRFMRRTSKSPPFSGRAVLRQMAKAVRGRRPGRAGSSCRNPVPVQPVPQRVLYILPQERYNREKRQEAGLCTILRPSTSSSSPSRTV